MHVHPNNLQLISIDKSLLSNPPPPPPIITSLMSEFFLIWSDLMCVLQGILISCR